jgi:hypothetical protein
MAKKEIIKPATSENMCAASTIIAREWERRPPMNSQIMKKKQMQETKRSFLIALLLVS